METCGYEYRRYSVCPRCVMAMDDPPGDPPRFGGFGRFGGFFPDFEEEEEKEFI